MKRLLLKITPKYIVSLLKKVNQTIEKLRNKHIRNEKTISKNEVIKLLNSFKLEEDVFLHTSLRKIGYEIEGGKKFIAELLHNIICDKGHVLLSAALPYRTLTQEYLEKTQYVDMSIAPNEMGAVNNILMQMYDSNRSLHPTHSVVSNGRNGQHYINEHHLDNTPFGRHSPYYKLMLYKGKILLFGVNLASMTFTHVIEDMIGEELYPINVYMSKEYKVVVKGFDNKDYEVVTKCHNPKASLLRDCESIRKYLIEAGVMKTKKLGLSEVSVIDAIGYNIVVCELLLQGISIYGHITLSEAAIKKVKQILIDLHNIKNNS